MAKTENKKPPKPPKAPKQKMSPQKKKKIYWSIGVGFVLLLIILAMIPAKGTMYYGVCKTYIELSELYPQQIVPLSVEDYAAGGGPVKIHFRKIDPFGVASVNTIECQFKRDTSGVLTYEISKIDINGKRIYEAESPDFIARFNKGVLGLVEASPDLTLPGFSLNDITRYKESE